MRSKASDTILVLGLIISILMGFLTFESARARRRASQAVAAEREVLRLNRDLEVIIDKRTEQLRQRTADLQTITDSVAHDLRNPLNSISINAQLLESQVRRGEFGEGSLKALGRIQPCVQQIAGILDRLMGLSELSHETFEPGRLDMHGLFIEVFETLQAAEPPPPIRFTIADDLPPAHADETLVRMLVMNLLGNALKYSKDRDERRIDVDFEVVDGVTVYSVSDNGIGFDSARAARLFTAFERLADSNRFEGSGLGLTIVQRVVHRHGGRAWGQGEPGTGALFRFTLQADPE
jgi:signal transduction histidine kinase